MVVGAPGLPGRADQLLEREIAGRPRILPVAVPRRRPVDADLALAHGGLQRFERGADAREELRSVDGLELRFGVVDVIDVERVEAEVGAASLDLVAEVAGRHAVRAARHVAGPDDSRLEVRRREPRARVARDGAVERDVAALGGDDDLVAADDPAADRGGQGRPY